MPDANRPSKSAAKSSAGAVPSRSGAPQLPPRVVKKKKPVKREGTGVEREKGPSAPASELLIPIILIVVGLIGTTATTIWFRPEGFPFGMYVTVRMIVIIASAVLTYGALFIAAQALDTDYGYISTGALKVIAITLTQDWLDDVVKATGIPMLPWIVGIVTTYSLFMYFFDLDLRDAIASVFVVRIVHFLAIVLLVAAIIGASQGGHSVDLPLPGLPGAADADEEPDDEGPLGLNDPNPAAFPEQ